MKSLLLKCQNCGRYTISSSCPSCGGRTVTVHPAKYSPDDKYARHRHPKAFQQQGQTT